MTSERSVGGEFSKLNTVNKTETIIRFDPVKLRAPFSLRCGALIIDYILFILFPTLSLLIGRMMGQDGNKLLNGELSNAGWLIAAVILISNSIIFPMLAGQSLGKLLTGLKIVKADGTSAGLVNILIRHLIGYPLTALTLGLGFLFSLFNSKNRALHDYLAGTTVIYGSRRKFE